MAFVIYLMWILGLDCTTLSLFYGPIVVYSHATPSTASG